MSIFTPQLKHHILTQYQPHSRENSFEALARRYAVNGGKTTVKYWHQQWDGTPTSLHRKPVSGRPRLLSSRQVNDYIRTPVRNKNRAHVAISYTQLLPSVQRKSVKQLSLRTLQNYGKRDLGIKMRHSKKRTADESK